MTDTREAARIPVTTTVQEDAHMYVDSAVFLVVHMYVLLPVINIAGMYIRPGTVHQTADATQQHIVRAVSLTVLDIPTAGGMMF